MTLDIHRHVKHAGYGNTIGVRIEMHDQTSAIAREGCGIAL